MPIEKPPAGTRGAKPPPRLVAKLLMPLMQQLHRLSGDQFDGMDVLYLHTLGARTGQARTSTVARMDDGQGGILVVASAAGAQQHPAWYHNIAPTPTRSGSSSAGRSSTYRYASSPVTNEPPRGSRSPSRHRGSRATGTRPTGYCQSCA